MHKQELLAIIAALKHFSTQPTLSKRQACWSETLANYNYKLSYVPGKQNAVADALSRFSFSSEYAALAVCGISAASISFKVLEKIRTGYAEDPFTTQLKENLDSLPGFSRKDGILYFNDTRSGVPKVVKVQEGLLHAIGHLGPRKTLSSLSLSFYWLGMARNVDKYVTECDGCQRHKAQTMRQA
ncbi:hypothetical protein JCM3770_003669 [Rhodotorula araucariae]